MEWGEGDEEEGEEEEGEGFLELEAEDGEEEDMKGREENSERRVFGVGVDVDVGGCDGA